MTRLLRHVVSCKRHVWSQISEPFSLLSDGATSDLLAGGCMWTHMMMQTSVCVFSQTCPDVPIFSNRPCGHFRPFMTIPRRKQVNLLDLQPGLIVCDLSDPFTMSTPPTGKKAPSQSVRICQNIYANIYAECCDLTSRCIQIADASKK